MIAPDARPMRQIPLELGAVEPPSLSNFVVGANAEIVAAIRGLADPNAGLMRPVYLWGEPGSGKTHLLEALCAAVGTAAIRLGPDSSIDRYTAEPRAGDVVVVDDCERLDAPRQEGLFHLYNRALASGSRFIAAGEQPPIALPLRDDLRTRLGWGCVLRLRALTDEDKASALRLWASSRGLRPPEELIRYLLTHRSRDIRCLLGLLEALDRHALEHKRALTLPLLRDLERQAPADPGQTRC
jgi:DnaA-homolog protein